MSESLSHPDQADELTDALRDASQRGRQKRSYFEYYNPLVEVPNDLKPFLPLDPVRVGATVKIRTDSANNLPEAALKLSWEYNPMESAHRAGDPDYAIVPRFRGTTFNLWHTHRNPSSIQRVSGMYEQPPMAPADTRNLSHQRFSELADEQRIMATAAEMQAWQRVEEGIADPHITFDEADLLIRFVRDL